MILLLLLIARATERYGPSSLKGKLVPGAKMLDQVLSRFLNRSDYTSAIFDYLAGNNAARRRTDNFDLTILDRENVKNIINNIKTTYQTQNLRRYRADAYYELEDSKMVKETALDMMKQSIYATRYRMNETRRFRKFYQNDPSFYIAMYYGALMEVSNKMETLFAIIKKLNGYSHFLWFLVIYEKILAANVDAHDMVERIFYLHDRYLDKFRGRTVPGMLIPTLPLPTGRASQTRRRRTRTRPVTRPRLTRPGQTTDSSEREERVTEATTVESISSDNSTMQNTTGVDNSSSLLDNSSSSLESTTLID